MRVSRTLLMTIAALAAAPLVASMLAQSAPTANHWPRFRGPISNPIAENPNLPVSWSKTENVEWAADVPGTGWSSPVVWGNRVFLTAATSDTPMKQPSLGVDFSNEYLAELRKKGFTTEEANKKLYERDREMPGEIVISLMLFCYDLETGKKLWERQMYTGQPAGGRHSKNSFASETPTVALASSPRTSIRARAPPSRRSPASGRASRRTASSTPATRRGSSTARPRWSSPRARRPGPWG